VKKAHAVVALLAIAAVTDGYTAPAANIGRGEQLARQWCASCHVVAADQQQTTTEAPPFATIARRPDFDVNRLAFFLLEPHPKMPNMSLSRSEAADIAAYIASLAK
jgi:mono/diheme cytochrome c family protein